MYSPREGLASARYGRRGFRARSSPRGHHRPTGELLFRSLATGREGILTDTRKLIDHVLIHGRFWEYVVTSAGSSTLQTLDGGAPVSIYKVGREHDPPPRGSRRSTGSDCDH
jgi:hypothetical protein